MSGVRQRLQKRTAAPGIMPHFGQRSRRGASLPPHVAQAVARTPVRAPHAGQGRVSRPSVMVEVSAAIAPRGGARIGAPRRY